MRVHTVRAKICAMVRAQPQSGDAEQPALVAFGNAATRARAAPVMQRARIFFARNPAPLLGNKKKVT